MKTMNICMMVVGMTFLGTTTSFGRNNNNKDVRRDMDRNGRKEIRMDNRRQEMRREDDRRTYRMQPVEHREEMRRHNNSDVVTGVVTGVVVGTVLNGLLNSITR
jgi:F0F1-type ATP synthase assembly protein I